MTTIRILFIVFIGLMTLEWAYNKLVPGSAKEKVRTFLKKLPHREKGNK